MRAALVSIPAVAAGLSPAVAAEPAAELVSVATGGAQANDTPLVDTPSLSANGRYAAFNSLATNLVPRDTNGQADVFLRDRKLGRTTRISVGAGGRQSNGQSIAPSVSADGRLVAFSSQATNLVPGDTNRSEDIFLRDHPAGTTTRVSVGPGGAQANGQSFEPSLAARAPVVAFGSSASNLVPGGTDGEAHVFVRDLRAGRTTQVDLGLGGAQPDGIGLLIGISADGRFVAFDSTASNLVLGGTDGDRHVFVRDLSAGTTVQVDVGPGGARPNGGSGNGDLSAGGRYVVFESAATNLLPGGNPPGLFLRDLEAGRTTLVTDRGGFAGGVSAGGRHVAFVSEEPGLVPRDTNGRADVFVYDVRAGTTARASVGPGGRQANGDSNSPEISDDGRTVAFASTATNLVPGDANDVPDVFARTR